MNKKALVLGLFITIGTICMIQIASALLIPEATIKDVLFSDYSINETVSISLSNNEKDYFMLTLPSEAYNIMVNGEAKNDSNLNISLDCRTCSINLSYSLNDITKPEQEHFIFSRTLNFPLIPQSMKYEVRLPDGYVIDTADNETDPPIVPALAIIGTDGKNIIINWAERNPSLPKRYFIKFQKSVPKESPIKIFLSKLLDANIMIIILVSFLLGGLTGYLFRNSTIKKDHIVKDNRIMVVPASLLSPDEKTVIDSIKKKDGKIGQKEIVNDLDWSKSKVSAILSNLEYKKVVSREKIGRNYTVRLIKEIE